VIFIVPYVFVYNNALLLIGNIGQIFRVCLTAFFGVLALAYAAQNYLGGRLPFHLRGLLFVGSGCLIHPGWITDLVGLGMVLPLMIFRLPGLRHLLSTGIFRGHAPGTLPKSNP
jgi:TRAP-type uncharacterized transport system fused permease subunit